MNFIYNFVKDNHLLSMIENCYERKSQCLNLSRFEIKELPNLLFGRCEHVVKLFINRNKIEKIPDEILRLDRLETLTIDFNCLTEFPAVICDLISLRFLNLSRNQIKELPSKIGHLTKLQEFWCNSTGLEIIPKEIGNLDRLEAFGARDNRVHELPETFGQLEKMLWITLENNQIEKLPETFKRLKKLGHLNLAKNSIKKFPSEILHLKTLQFCFLSENSIDEVEKNDLNDMKFIKRLQIYGNPFINRMDKVEYLSYPHIVFENREREHSPAENLDEMFNNDDVVDSSDSDWENSVETTEIDSTEESGDDRELENVTFMIPKIARFTGTFN